jgi:branched-chain amino acid transport system substrate-binding protein
MSKKYSITICSFFVILLLSLIGCGKKDQDKYLIGGILPLTGDLANYGTACKRGMDMAIEDINNSQGINGKKLEILYEDSKASPKEAVSIAQKLINIDGVQVLVGEVASTATLAMIPIAEKAKVFLLAPASSSPKLTGASEYFARNWPSDVAEATATANFIQGSMQKSKAIIFYVNSDYGIGLESEFRKAFISKGGTVIASENYPFGETNFRSVIQKIIKLQFDCIYLAGNHKEMAFLTKQLREYKVNQPIVGDTDYGDPEVVNVAGVSCEGAIYGTPSYDPKDLNNLEVVEFTKKFEAKYGTFPTLSEANGYDAIKLIASAIKLKGYNGTEIAAAVRATKNYRGAAGNISFENGDVIRSVIFKRIVGGRPEYYK